MLSRHIIALLITVAFYYIPTGSICNDFLYFPVHAFWSAIYITLIYSFAKTRIMHFLIAVEIVSIIFTVPAYTQWFLSSKSQWFYTNFEHIMLICFMAEIVVIILGAMHGGIHKLFLSMRLYIIHAFHSIKTNILATWYALCKIKSNS